MISLVIGWMTAISPLAWAESSNFAEPPAGTEKSTVQSPASPSKGSVASQPVALPTKTSEKKQFSFQFKEKKWKELVVEIAGPLGYSVQMDFDPPGSFTYNDPKKYSYEQALELVHGELLDRGVTLLRANKMLLGVRLADNLHQSLTPFVPSAEVKSRKDNLAVFTTIKLNSIVGKDAKSELISFLSPRGRISETSMPNRIAVWDRCDFVRDLMAALDLIDPPGLSNAVPLKTYALKFARAEHAAQLVREVLGMEKAKPAGNQPGQPDMRALVGRIVPDFERMGRDLGTRKMAESFVPGVSLKGTVPDSIGSVEAQLELAVDESRNLLLARGDRKRLALVDQVVASLDRKDYDPSQGDGQTEVRTYTLTNDDGEKAATAIRTAVGEASQFFAAGSGNRLLVRGTKKQLLEVEAILERLKPTTQNFAVLDVPPSAAELLAKQLTALFEHEAKASRPTIVGDASRGKLLVRGSAHQCTQVQRFVETTYPPPRVNAGARRSSPADLPPQS